MSIRRRAMNRRRLFQALSLLFGLLLAASILTPQGGAQEGIKFEMPKDDVKKKVVKPAAPSPATVEMLNGQSARIDSLTDGDAVKLKVTLDKPVELAYVASFKFADDGRQIDKCIITPGAQSCETKVAPALGWYWGKDGKGQAARFSAPGRAGTWPGGERRHVGRVHEAGRLSGGDRIARIRGRRRAGRRSDAHGRPVAAAQTDEDNRAERRRACPLRGRSQTRDRRADRRSGRARHGRPCLALLHSPPDGRPRRGAIDHAGFAAR